MNNNQVDALLPIKIAHIITIMMEEEKIDFITATALFYKSKIYEHLIDYEQKFWHFSANKIYDLWKMEKNHKSLTVDDV